MKLFKCNYLFQKWLTVNLIQVFCFTVVLLVLLGFFGLFWLWVFLIQVLQNKHNEAWNKADCSVERIVRVY